MPITKSNVAANDEEGAPHARDGETSFAAEALRWGGKSDEEVSRTGAVDAADEQIDALFAARYGTVNSPVHRAVWERSLPADLFGFARAPQPHSAAAQDVIRRSLDLVRRRRDDSTLLDERGKIGARVLQELAQAGYWGLLIDPKYGGSGASFSQFASLITDMAMIDPTAAGLASVHGCIGAVDPLSTFGQKEQKERLLPKLARGERLSAFALTEPCAGSDLTALRTTATLDGDDYVVDGEKLFITNVVPGRMIGLVCLIDSQPSVLIAELPEQEDEHFRLVCYGLHALRRAHNHGIVFHGFRVPAANRLVPSSGDGLTIAYHGLNRGRVVICATAAGTMRSMLADMLPWAHFRRTYGAAIETRELVRRRIGHLAGLIVACDALTEWCAGLLDLGYRGEMECVVAKIFGSEAQKEAAIELYMKTHGGRSFLAGHPFGDNVHEFLAPCIYEGEGEMLGMAFFKSLVKQHGRTYFEPLGKALQAAGIHHPNLANPAQLWRLRGLLSKYAGWWLSHRFRPARRLELPALPAELREAAEFAADFLQHSSLELSGALRKHQLKLADRQCRMAELSGRVQTAVVILCTSLYGGRCESELVREAAGCLCRRLVDGLVRRRPDDRYFRKITELGAAIAEQGFDRLDQIVPGPILMRYEP